LKLQPVKKHKEMMEEEPEAVKTSGLTIVIPKPPTFNGKSPKKKKKKRKRKKRKKNGKENRKVPRKKRKQKLNLNLKKTLKNQHL